MNRSFPDNMVSVLNVVCRGSTEKRDHGVWSVVCFEQQEEVLQKKAIPATRAKIVSMRMGVT